MSPIKIFYQNVRGLRTKTSEFYCGVCANSYDVICLTETWLMDGIKDRELFDNRYLVWRRDRDYSQTNQSLGGGVLIAVRSELVSDLRSEWYSSAEDLWITLCLHSQMPLLSYKMHICVVYICKQNYGNSQADQLSNFSNNLTDIVFQHPVDKFLVLGDFNLPNISWELDSEGHWVCPANIKVELFYNGRKLAAHFTDGIYGFHTFPVTSVNIFNPEDIEIITSNVQHHEKGFLYIFLRSWLQEGLLLSNGLKWQQRRKILTSAFHFNVLQKYFKTMKDNDKILIEYLKKSKGEPVNIVSRISEYTLNIICETAMGTKLSEEDCQEGNKYKEAIYDLGKNIIKRFSSLYLLSDFIFNFTLLGKRQKNYLKIVHDFTTRIIEKRKKAINSDEVSNFNDIEDETNSKKKRAVMLDLLINVQKDGLIDDVGIQEEVDTFMFEGHDTTACGLTYTLLLLANYPDIQNKIFDELKEIFGKDTRDTTTDDLAAMKYLELCIKESMRLYPPVPLIMRQIKQTCKLSNYDIPANTLCSIHIYDLHRNEKIYKNPHKFDPERFLPENCVGRHNYAYIPFSAGPRNCIVMSLQDSPEQLTIFRITDEHEVGAIDISYTHVYCGQKFAMMEMKNAVSSILRHFKLVPVTKEEDLCFTADLVLRNTKPIYVKFLERKDD